MIASISRFCSSISRLVSIATAAVPETDSTKAIMSARAASRCLSGFCDSISTPTRSPCRFFSGSAITAKVWRCSKLGYQSATCPGATVTSTLDRLKAACIAG